MKGSVIIPVFNEEVFIESFFNKLYINLIDAHDLEFVFVDDGKVLDVGSHDELYARCEVYRRAVELQRLEDERKEDNNA